jgi:hypothetical protein
MNSGIFTQRAEEYAPEMEREFNEFIEKTEYKLRTSKRNTEGLERRGKQ